MQASKSLKDLKGFCCRNTPFIAPTGKGTYLLPNGDQFVPSYGKDFPSHIIASQGVR